MAADDRAAYIDGLRQLAGVLEEHEEIPLPFSGSITPLQTGFYGDGAREQMAAAVRAMPGKWVKDASDKWLNLTGQLAGLRIELYAERDAVCTRVVTGTEEREVEKVITPAVTEKVTETVELVEWDCSPILAPREVA